MTLTIASGKGGTGKTTFAVNLAYALAWREAEKPVSTRRQIRLLDCDVEEPNDHLFVRPDFTKRTPVIAPKPVWSADLCKACGKCVENCNYNALALVKGKILLFSELCHSCGVCSYVCPTGALVEKDSEIGIVEAAPNHNPFFFAHGKLNLGEALSPKVVGAVKESIEPGAINIIDASPGTACPVVEAVGGSDAVLLVTEPTPFGLHDLKLAAALSLQMKIPTGIVVNRSDGEDILIADFAEKAGIPIAGRIPFSRDYAEAYSEGAIIVERFPELRDNLLQIFDDLTVAMPPPPVLEEFPAPAKSDEPVSGGSSSSYKEVIILSGKGGTGKTTVAAGLATLSEDKILADCDVDAADLHLLLEPTIREAHDFIGGKLFEILPDACTACGQCAEACHFNAIFHDGPLNDRGQKTFRIEPLACEGCGLCALICKFEAIKGEPQCTGQWFVSDTRHGCMVHARLGIAEENSGRLVTQVRQRAAELTRERSHAHLLGDGPPGTACPVIASVSGTDLALLVTEPTVSGVHDLDRVLRLLDYFEVPAAVVINKADLNEEQNRRIAELASERGAKIIGRIPFDPAVQVALRNGKTIVEHGKGKAAAAVTEIWKELKDLINSL